MIGLKFIKNVFMSDIFADSNCKSYIDNVSDHLNYPEPDLTYLNEMAEGDENFIKEIIEIFLKTCPESLILLQSYTSLGDHEKLKFVAHKLLPELTFVGILSAIPDVEKISKESESMNDLAVTISRVVLTINSGMEELRKMI